jgi:hypothetical protein
MNPAPEDDLDGLILGLLASFFLVGASVALHLEVIGRMAWVSVAVPSLALYAGVLLHGVHKGRPPRGRPRVRPR